MCMMKSTLKGRLTELMLIKNQTTQRAAHGYQNIKSGLPRALLRSVIASKE